MGIILSHVRNLTSSKLQHSEHRRINSKLTKRMAFASLVLLILAIFINLIREPLLGIQNGYAPYNLIFNFLFYLPTMLISLLLSLSVIRWTIKHWNTLLDNHEKLLLLGMSMPSIGVWIFIVLKILIAQWI